MNTTLRYLSAEQQQEVERFRRASEEMVQRARQDPQFARSLLRDIGYYEMMGLPDPGNGEAPAQTTIRKTTKRQAVARKAVPAKRKQTTAKP